MRGVCDRALKRLPPRLRSLALAAQAATIFVSGKDQCSLRSGQTPAPL